MKELIIDISNLLSSDLTFDEYFVLYCIYTNNKKLLEEYAISRQINYQFYQNLIDKEYLFPLNDDKVTFNSLKLTKSFEEEFIKDVDFDKLFEELKNTYPKSIKNAFGARRILHTDMNRCRKLYKDTIRKDIDKHNLILKCIKLYIKDKKDGNSLEFIQALPAFLHQRNWEAYVEEANEIEDVNTSDRDEHTAI
jgi:hypothetical protein